MQWIIIAQAVVNEAVRQVGIIEAAMQFGMAGAVILVVAAFLVYQERQAVRQERLDAQRYEVINGLRAEVKELAGSINRFDSHLNRFRQ